MTRAINGLEPAYLRSPNQASALKLAFPESHIIFEAQVNQTVTTTDSIVELTYYCPPSAYDDYTQILPGMTVWFGPVVNDYSLGIARIRKVADGTKIYIGETSDIKLTDGIWFTVVDDFLPWVRYGRDKTVDPVTVYMDWDIDYSDQYANPNPVVNMGVDGVIYKPDSVIDGGHPATLDFNDVDSFMPDGSAIATHLWEALGSDISIVNDTTPTPTFSVTATGTWKVSDTITGTNGKSTTAWRTIVAYDLTHPPVNQFNLTSMPTCDRDNDGGWNFSVRMYDQAALASVKDRQQVILFARDWYGDVTSLTATDIAFDAATKTISAAAGLDVFGTSATIQIAGSVNNDGIYTVKTGAVATAIVINEALKDESAGASITINVLFAQTEISLGPVVSRENIICMGWIAKESLHYDPNGAYVDFTVQGMAYWLNQAIEYILGIEDTDSTSHSWLQIHHMTWDMGLFALLYWRSTLCFIADYFPTGDTRAIPVMSEQEGSLWAQIKSSAWNNLLAIPCCNRYGQLYVFIPPELIPSGAPRSSIPTVMTVTTSDLELGKLDLAREPLPKTSFLAGAGGEYSFGSGGVATARIAYSPGHAYKQWGVPDTLPQIVVTGQAQLNSLNSLYIARANNTYPSIPLSFAQNNRFIDCAPGQFIYLDRSSVDNPREVEFAGNVIPSKVTLTFDPKLGFMSCQVQGYAETFEDLVITGTVPAPAAPNVPAPVVVPPYPPVPFPVPNPLNPMIAIADPEAATKVLGRLNVTRSVIRLDAIILDGTSLTFNLETRTVIGTTGTPLMATDLTVTTSGAYVITFSNPILLAGTWLVLVITSVVGSVSSFACTLSVVV